MKQKRSFKNHNRLTIFISGALLFVLLGAAGTKIDWSQLNTSGTPTDGYIPKLVSGVVTWSPDASGGAITDGTYGNITVSGTGTTWNVNSSYTGSSSITTLGTIGTGIWQGNILGAAYLPNGSADGTTKGILALNANDFSSTSGVATIDYTNAQAATGSVKGFLTSGDWNTFNNKLTPTQLKIETPTGTVDGSNTIFTLSATPVSSTIVVPFVNGVAQRITDDFTISTNTVTFVTPPTTSSNLMVLFVAP